jgi:hypothetical protein
VKNALGRGRERDILVPDGPHNPSEFIGHGNGGFVVAAPFPNGDRPLVQAGQGLGVAAAALRSDQHGASAMREQATEIDIAPFTDGAKMPAWPARVFAWGEPEPVRELPGPP